MISLILEKGMFWQLLVVQYNDTIYPSREKLLYCSQDRIYGLPQRLYGVAYAFLENEWKMKRPTAITR